MSRGLGFQEVTRIVSDHAIRVNRTFWLEWVSYRHSTSTFFNIGIGLAALPHSPVATKNAFFATSFANAPAAASI